MLILIESLLGDMLFIYCMPKIVIPEDVQGKIIDEHGSGVLERLNQEIDKKNDMLEWKSSLKECFPRFRVVTQYADEYFVEIGFQAKNRDYRAIGGWVENKQQFLVLTICAKNDHYQTSKQSEIFNLIGRHGRKIMDNARE